MSRYALRSRRNTVATGPALSRVDSPLSELSESGTASAQDSVPGPAASRVPASGKAALRNPPPNHVEVEEENSSPSDSEDDEDVGPRRNLTATGISKNLSRSNVEDANESDTSGSSNMESKRASSKTDAEEPATVQPARPARLRHTQSLDDLNMHTVHFKERENANKLTKEQASTVRAAERNLTKEQREILAKHQNKITREQTQNQPESPDATPGPSSYIAKGKFVDRNQEIDDSELDIEAQREALHTWNQVHDEIQESLDGDQAEPENETHHEDDFTTVRKSSRRTKASGKSTALRTKKTAGKTGRYDVLEVEETSDEDLDDPEPVKHQKKHTKSRKKTSRKKTVHDLEPLASAFDRRMADVVRGNSRAPSSSHHGSRHGSTCPTDQLPADSFLANVLKVGKSKKKTSQERKRKLNKKKSDKRKTKRHATSSDSDPSSSDSSSSDELSSDSDYSYSSPSNSDPLGSDSSPSSSSGDSSDSDSSGDSSYHGHRRRHRRWRHGSRRRHRHSRRRHRHDQKRIIKPIPPTPYDGTADGEKFHRFTMEMTQFCKEGQVPEDEQASSSSRGGSSYRPPNGGRNGGGEGSQVPLEDLDNENVPDLESVSEADDSGNSDYDSDNEWDIQAADELNNAPVTEAEPSAASPDASHEPESTDLEAFINDFGSIECNEALPVPGIENFGLQWCKEDASAKDRNGEPFYCWTDDAKEVFGYPETGYSNFVLYHKTDLCWRPTSIGDFYQYAAEMCLNHDAPYPGDELRWGAVSSHRFGVFRLNNDSFTIVDTESEHGELTISASLLRNPKFHIGAWYAKQCSKLLARSFDSTDWFNKSSELGDALTQGLHFVLSHGTSLYPNLKEFGFNNGQITPYSRFTITREAQTDKLTIVDQSNLAILQIDAARLENPYFDAIGWLSKNLKAFVAMHYESFLLDELRFEKLKRAEAVKVRSEQWRMQRMGSVLVEALEMKLHESQPYPGDTSEPCGHLRFTVWESKEEHMIKFIDHDRGLGGELPFAWVLDPQFSPGEFWGKQLAMFCHIPTFENMDYPRMGHPLATAARKSLTKHVPFIKDSENLGDDVQYYIYPHPGKSARKYMIEDIHRNFKTSVPIKYLMNPNFDLPSWYQKKLDQAYEKLLQQLRGPVEYEFLTRFFSQNLILWLQLQIATCT
ncbi:hypothetical protein IW261DRAFT_1648893 [Armillaria novae-zelandiae]|uniref:Uncharacterized protein n=1 Tax=Armillaria novae-zelandiae TaxID=153914 RepID=A0AA39NZR5_9AGAR|nr:hypothetical protein IW261DRAFT_1648893 [Armillaria novae-zelandiae]